jgi:hypothetical protein
VELDSDLTTRRHEQRPPPEAGALSSPGRIDHPAL